MYLVTGGTGFVGGHMIDLLLEKRERVRALVRNSQQAKSLETRGIELVEGNLNDKESLRRAVSGCKGVFHIGAVFREAKLPDSAYFEINVEGTRKLFEASIEACVPRIIYCSTNGVHGDVKNPPADETYPYAPCDVYQESKVASEKIVFDFYRSGKISGVIIRPAMIYGPKDTRLLKIFKMINKGRFFYVGPGNALCHFIDVRDLVVAFYEAMMRTNLNAEAYLIANDRIIPLNEFCNLVADILGVRHPWIHIPLVPMQLLGDLCEYICKPFGIEPPLYRRRVDFYIKNRSFRVDKAKRDLGFSPARSFEGEVKDIVNWCRKSGYL